MARIVDHEGEVLKVRSKVEQFAAIRRDHRIEELSVRALAKRHGVHRRTVRQALESAVPPERKVSLRVAPRLAPYKAAVDEMLRSDVDAPKKQRHTARRVLARLVDEHGAAGLSYSTVRDYVRKRRPQILAEAGKPLEVGFVPQNHPPAAEGEVDFHDLWVILGGVKTKTGGWSSAAAALPTTSKQRTPYNFDSERASFSNTDTQGVVALRVQTAQARLTQARWPPGEDLPRPLANTDYSNSGLCQSGTPRMWRNRGTRRTSIGKIDWHGR